MILFENQSGRWLNLFLLRVCLKVGPKAQVLGGTKKACACFSICRISIAEIICFSDQNSNRCSDGIPVGKLNNKYFKFSSVEKNRGHQNSWNIRISVPIGFRSEKLNNNISDKSKLQIFQYSKLAKSRGHKNS